MNRTPESSFGDGSDQEDLAQLRDAVSMGRYTVSAEMVAAAFVRWHLGFAEGRLPHEAVSSRLR